MYNAPLDLKKARILISNDDGIHAPGLEVVVKIAQSLCDDVWVVAPATEQSATGHSLTLRRPLRINKHGEKRYSVDGTPTDSVLLALNKILTDKKPDLILSGVNRGGNLGEDITYSGTVAAAMEGTLLGVPSIAFSQFYEDRNDVNWAPAETWGTKVLEKLANTVWPENTLMNVNFPDCPSDAVKGMQATAQGRRKIGDDLAEGKDPRGEPYYWLGALRTAVKHSEGSDLYAVQNGYISVTPISLDFCDHKTLDGLQDKLG